MLSRLLKTLLSGSLLLGICLHAKELPEYQLKAGYIYNIMKFVKWPQKEKLVVCILGENPFKGYLEEMQKRKIAGMDIEVVHTYSAAELQACDLIYVNVADFKKIENLFTHVLTISDEKDFLDNGGMIKLVKEQQQVKIMLNYKKINAQGFTISSKLLKTSIVGFYEPNKTSEKK